MGFWFAGVLRWCVELGNIATMTDVYVLFSHLCLLREGHLDTVYHLFVRLVLNQNAQVVCNPAYTEIDESSFINTDWRAMYREIKEVDPIDAPTPLCKEVDLRLYVDYDQAGEKFTRFPEGDL
jgi:hypothetical protein